MNLKKQFVLGYRAAMTVNKLRFILFGGLPLGLLLVGCVSPEYLPHALVGMAALLIGGPFALGKMAATLLQNARLEPAYGYGPGADAEAIERLETALTALGFTSAGLYRLNDAFTHILLREDLQAYASVLWGAAEGVAATEPFVEYCSFYEGERSYNANNTKNKALTAFTPDSLIHDCFPGKDPGGLLEIFLSQRPETGLLESTVEKIPEYFEMELRLIRKHWLEPKKNANRGAGQ